MDRRGSHGGLTTAFTLLLACIAALCVLAVLALGANIYRNTALQAETGYGGRTCTAYIASRLRAADGAAALEISAFGDGDALSLRETGPGEAVYTNRIYVSDGWLCELYADEALGLGPDSGSRIAPADSLSITAGDGLLHIVCGTPDGPSELFYSLRSGGEAAW